MNRLITFITIVLCASINCLAQKEVSPYKLGDIKHIQNSQLFKMLGPKNEWKDDFNGAPCALICVKFVNMPKDEIRSLQFLLNGNAAATTDKLDYEAKEMWVFVPATKNGIFEIVDSKGIYSNRISNLKLKSKECYEATLTCDKRQTINIHTLPIGARIMLDGEHVSTGQFNDVTHGIHTIEISYNGTIMKTAQIEVSDINNSFEFDLRPKKKFKIKTDPSDAVISINGKDMGFSPLEIELPHDNYLIEARLSETETDSKTITVNEFTEDILLEPIKRKSFEVSAVYQSKPVEADLYVDGQIYKDKQGNIISGQYRYTFTEPIGREMKMRMSFGGASSERKIKVTQDMNPNQQFEIKPRNSITWPWERDYDTDAGGVSFAYVQKQLVTKGNSEQLKENGIWDNSEGKWLSGMQFGMHFQPAFSWGLGVYTGLFYELYMSFNDNYDYNMYMEHDLYLPIHAYYRIPFGEKIALKIHGGLGLSYAIAGTFSQTDDSYGYEDITDVLGNDAYPNAFNMTLDIGLSFRIKNVQINASYCKGLNDHGSYHYIDNGYKTTQNKMTIGASWVIGTKGY